MQGDFRQGWFEYEWRWKCSEFAGLAFHQPRWDGSPLAGRTILLHAEQGLGDTLQFIRYAPWVRQCGGRVLVLCQPPLLSLLASCPGIDQLVERGAPLPDFDVHAPLLSLPGIFQTDLTSIPAQVPYLSVDAQLVEHWRRQLNTFDSQPTSVASERQAGVRPGFKVGVAWQGSPTHAADRQRSIPLRAFAPLAQLPGVRLFSLQVGPGTEQLRGLDDRFPVIDLGRRFNPASFQDAAAVATVLDLVITVDMRLAHLGECWVSRSGCCCRMRPIGVGCWSGRTVPGIPLSACSANPIPGDWDAVFERLADALARQLSRRPESSSPSLASGGRQPPDESVNQGADAPRSPVGLFRAGVVADQATIQEPNRVVGEEAPQAESVATLALGLQHHQAGYLPQAEQIYQQILQRDATNVDTLAYLGDLYMAQGRSAEAATTFQQLLQLRPQFLEVYINLGVVLAQQGRMDEAVATFQQALALKPDYPDAHNNLGIVLAHQERFEEAISHYERALQLRPDYAEAHNNLGIALARQKKLREAVASYQEALRLKADYAEAHNNLGAVPRPWDKWRDARQLWAGRAAQARLCRSA